MARAVDPMMEAFQAREFSRLEGTGHVYLDYTGSGLYPESLVREHLEQLRAEVLGNPHSRNPTSSLSTALVDEARQRIRSFFGAREEEYEVVFTPNATGALKLVAESFPFREGSHFVLTADNHNSVNGIREFAARGGAEIRYVPLRRDLRSEDPAPYLDGADAEGANLFAYPAQSNFSGVKHPLDWIDEARSRGYAVVLDAAAFVPGNALDLTRARPDFACVSFYKLFGYPTGVGALIARREALRRLRRPWFAGGTVRFASAQNRLHLLQPTGEAFEDGTLNFLGIAALTRGLDLLADLGMERIQAHIGHLTVLLLEALTALRHGNGAPLVRVYGPRTAEARGGTIAFNVLDPAGALVECGSVESLAGEHGLSLRTGCFCNPGAAEAAFAYGQVESYRCFQTLSPEDFTLQQFSRCMDDKPVGAVRASLGLASSARDIERLVSCLQAFVDSPAPAGARVLPVTVGH